MCLQARRSATFRGPVLPADASSAARMAKYEELKFQFESWCKNALKGSSSNLLQSNRLALLENKVAHGPSVNVTEPQPLELRTPFAEKDALSIIGDVYGAHGAFDGATLSVQDCAAFSSRAGGVVESAYGEVTPHGAVQMIRAMNATPGERYYDIGAGTGKTVILAWLLGLHAAGIELSEARWWESCQAVMRLRKLRNAGRGVFMDENEELEFIKGSFDSFDFSDADIIFVDNLLWEETTIGQLESALELLRVGARIASAKPLRSSYLALRNTVTLDTSWAEHGTIFQIYEHVGQASKQQGFVTKKESNGHIEACS